MQPANRWTWAFSFLLAFLNVVASCAVAPQAEFDTQVLVIVTRFIYAWASGFILGLAIQNAHRR